MLRNRSLNVVSTEAKECVDSALASMTISNEEFLPSAIEDSRPRYHSTEEEIFSLSQQLRKAQQVIFNYDQDNKRLREQLKAAALRERLINERVKELVDAQRKEKYSPAYGFTSDEDVTKRLREEVQQLKDYITSLELNQCQLEGKVKAYEESIQRRFEDHPVPTETPLREVLCEALSVSNYLVKVVNAVHHCYFTPHRTQKGTLLEKQFAESICARTIHECREKCLRATSEGNMETDVEMKSRVVGCALDELLYSLLEELLYCESTCVTVASTALARRGSTEDEVLDTAKESFQVEKNSDLTAPSPCSPPAKTTPPPRTSPTTIPKEECEVQ